MTPGRFPLRRRLLVAAAVLGVLLLPMQLSVAAFDGASGTTASWQADALDPPADLTANRPCPVAPALRSQSTGSKPAGTPTATVSRPPGVVAGDVIVVFGVVADPNWGANASLPPGWQALSPVSDPVGGLSGVALYRVVSASEPATYSFSTSAAAAFVLLAYSGVQTSAPIAAQAAAVVASGTSIAAPSVSPAMARTVLLTGLIAANEDTIGTPAGTTAQGSATTPSPVDVVSVSDEIRVAAGATGARAGDVDPATSGIGLSVALRPATPNLTLSWTPAADAYVTGYQLVRTGGGTSTVNVSGRATAAYADTGTNPATAYSYALRSAAGTWRSAPATVAVAACS